MSSPVTSISGLITTDPSSVFAQRRQDFQSLGDALQTGDLQAAQSAFASLQQTLGRSNATGSTSGSAPSGQAGQSGSALQALGTALQSGDISAAQQAFTALTQSHHSHHHHRQGGTNGQPSAINGTSGASPSQLMDGVGTTISVKA